SFLTSIALVCLSSVSSDVRCSAERGAIHSFPTRRSSDLVDGAPLSPHYDQLRLTEHGFEWSYEGPEPAQLAFALLYDHLHDATRSEEHTSELQSRFDLVCRLLLEKKKTTTDIRPSRCANS